MSRFILCAIALSLLGACGLRGELERPPPMGDEARARYEEDRAKGVDPERQRPRGAAENAPGIGTGSAQGNDAVRIPDF